MCANTCNLANQNTILGVYVRAVRRDTELQRDMWVLTSCGLASAVAAFRGLAKERTLHASHIYLHTRTRADLCSARPTVFFYPRSSLFCWGEGFDFEMES